MAAITTAAAGNWSATGTWTGGVVPGDGDTVTINHATTVDVNTVVGSAPATGGTAAINVSGGGPLTINAELELKGDLTLTGRNVVMGAGAKIIFNPASGVEYRLNVSTAHGQANTITANGTSGSHCEIRKKSGAAGTARCRGQSFQRAGKGVFTYTDFIDLGSSSVDAYDFWLNVDADVLTFDNCTFTNCGQILESVGGVGDADLRFQDCVFSSGAGTYSINLQSTQAVTTGSRLLQRVACDKAMNLNNAVDVTMIETRHAQVPVFAGDGTLGSTSRDNFVWNGAASGSPMVSPKGTMTRWFLTREPTSNPHWLQASTSGACTFDKIIMHCTLAGELGGDGIIGGSPGSARVYTVTNCILLPDVNGLAPGKVVSLLGNANVTFSITHCTYPSTGTGSETGIAVGETYAGHTGMISAEKSNISWRVNGAGGFRLQRVGGSVQDIVNPANTTHNATLNMDAGNDGGGVNHNGATAFFSTGSPNANGVVLASNPFVDNTRNLATWDASKGGAGTDAAAKTRLLALSGATDVADLIDYIFAGFAVTGAQGLLLKDLGHDAGTIGAGIYVAAGAAVAIEEYSYSPMVTPPNQESRIW